MKQIMFTANPNDVVCLPDGWDKEFVSNVNKPIGFKNIISFAYLNLVVNNFDARDLYTFFVRVNDAMVKDGVLRLCFIDIDKIVVQDSKWHEQQGGDGSVRHSFETHIFDNKSDLWTVHTVKLILEQAGFKDIVESTRGNSPYSAFSLMDRKNPGDADLLSYIEATK